jgi:hypothetical protein
MKATDQLLERLFRAAADVPQPEQVEPSFATEVRALAAWRAACADEPGAVALRYYRVGFAFASVLMAMIVALSLHQIARAPGDELAIPTVALNLALSK